jgi:NAD(P)-dependent dehydrogenase (short-subunit alcohol dehydrogenase family)
MDLNLGGAVAIVTGAGKGIGLAVTKALADEGAQVVAGSLTTGSLDGLKGVTPVAVDLSLPDGPAELVRRATEEHGQVDVLVNNVGAVRMRTRPGRDPAGVPVRYPQRRSATLAALRSSRSFKRRHPYLPFRGDLL